MKSILALVLAAAATTAYGESAGAVQPKAPKKSRSVSVLSIARHADSWCHLHHQSGGAAGCTKHPGCSYSKKVDELFKKQSAYLTTKTQDLESMTGEARSKLEGKLNTLRENLDTYGPCHSSDHHAHDWCNFYGSKDTKSCIGLSMCTWKVGEKDADGKRGQGKCMSEVTEQDFPDIKSECYENMGDADDADYAVWKTCVEKSRDSADGKKCVKLSCFQKPGSCDTVEMKDPISQTAVWFPAKKECASYKTCKRDTNIVPNDRCAEGFGFLWELPSNKPIKTKTGEKANTKVGTHKFGCRELYNYKANCAKVAAKACGVTKMNNVAKVCTKDIECDTEGDTCKVTGASKNGAKYAANQYDEDKLGFDGYFCVSEDGHEIPDTRKMRPVELFDINCDIMRKKNDGQQCPNAVTLSTRGGVAVINKKRGSKKCDYAVTCNSDTDCKGDKWCCFNGCGYQCKLPVKPLSGCAALPGTKNEQVAQQKWQIVNDSTASTGAKRRHGIKIMVKCGNNFAQTPSKVGQMPIQQMELVCEHGEWAHCPGDEECIKGDAMEALLVCSKDCPPFQLVDTQVNRIDADGASETITIKATVVAERSGKNLYSETKPLRNRDFVETARSGFEAVVGDSDKLRHHTATRTISCPTGYGAVQHQKFLGLGRFKAVKKDPRSMHIVRHGYETLECTEGEWTNRRLECSICYDAYEWQWRDMKGNSCAFYRSRPLECHNTGSQVIAEGTSTYENCGTYSTGWAEQGRFMLNKGMITAPQYREFFQPYGEIEWTKSAEGQTKYKVNDNFYKAPNGKKTKGDARKCMCLPFFQPSYSKDLKGESSSPSSDCGQVTQGKKVFVNPNTGEKFADGQFFYMQQSSYGNASDNCRVACRSCEDAESKYLLRTSYSKDEFKMFLDEGKIKTANVDPDVMEGGTAEKGSGGKWKMVKRRVLKWTTIPNKTTVTKKISKSYPISMVCTDGKGMNFLKCQDNDVRSICKGDTIDEKTKCKAGYTPMA